MHFKSYSLVAALLLAAPFTLRAQNELSNFTATGRGGVVNAFATDYQAIGVNPANLGRLEGGKFAFTIGEFGIGAGSQSLSRTQLRNLIYNRDQTLTQDEKQQLARSFSSANALQVNADVTALGFSFYIPHVGGIAVSSRQRATGNATLNRNAAELLFLGQEASVYADYDINSGRVPLVSEVLAGSRMQASILNEYNIAWGTDILDLPNFQLTAGAGYRYIQGIGVIDIKIEPGNLQAYTSLSPALNVDYGDLTSNPDFNLKVGGTGLRPVGTGHGFDLGLGTQLGPQRAIRLGLSLTDIGHMTWKGNLLTANDQKLKKLNSTGVGTYEFFKEAAEIFATGTDSLFQYETAQSYRAALPTKLRAGAGWRITDKWSAGLDVTLPLNKVAGNLPAPFVGAGFDYRPRPWVALSSGVSAGAGYRVSLPVGVAFTAGVYEAGISTRDVVGLFSEKNPYLSVAAGFLRFRFGQRSAPTGRLPRS